MFSMACCTTKVTREIREHYTDTAGFTDHVFALMHLMGFALCPRIRDLHDKKLFIKGKADQYPAIQSLISTTSLNLKEIEIHWREVLRLAISIKQETVTASLMLKTSQLPEAKRTCQITERNWPH